MILDLQDELNDLQQASLFGDDSVEERNRLHKRIESLKARKIERMKELDLMLNLTANLPEILTQAIVIPVPIATVEWDPSEAKGRAQSGAIILTGPELDKLRQLGDRAWLYIVTFCKSEKPRHQIAHIKYFTAKLDPRPDDPHLPLHQATCLRALATQLLLDAFKDRFETAVIISGDSDLLAPIQAVMQEFKKPVGVLNPQKIPSRMLERHATFYKQIRTGVNFWLSSHSSRDSSPPKRRLGNP